jgi:predicted ATP-grasp superfamily ATP-dependent carboligase
MSDVTVSEVLRRADIFGKGVSLPFVRYSVYDEASDKAALFRLALELDVPIPATLFSSDYDERPALIKDASELGFPVVLKPARSRIRTPDGWLSTNVRYAGCVSELEALLDSEPFKSHSFLIQEKIIGPGIGIFLLMQDGRVQARFAHRRIREKPPWGGVSVLCESIAPPGQALDAAIRLLEKLKWTGVAMVELKLDQRSGIARLMEVNARFWGSLQLAVSAGVDFPRLLYRMASGDGDAPSVAHWGTYKTGLRSRWELGDLDHLLIRLRKSGSQPELLASLPPKSRAVKDFMLDFFRGNVRNEVLRPDDPLPFMSEFCQYMRDIIF